jgi:putative ABC transport system permease protein
MKKRGFSRGLQAGDAALLGRDSSLIEAIAAVRISQQIVSARGEQLRAQVYGITPSYGVVHDREVAAGRWLQDSDQLEARKVAVLGADLAEKLFGTDDPIGKPIRVGDAAFHIVGVEERIGNRFANSGWVRREMNGVLVPLSAFRAYLQAGQDLSVLSVKTADKDRLELVKAEVERLMRRAHHGIGDFHIENIADEMLRAEKEITTILRGWTIVLASIAGISLLVGGVGIYSVMKISLVERLYEIGLRKAMGATDRAILTQFLVESTTLSVLGALVGCGLAVVVTGLLSGQFEAGLPLSPLGLALGVGFAVATGLFAGVFPASSASRLTPVQALCG